MKLNTIYNQDCVSGMGAIDNASVDLVITDPPYEISKEANFASSAFTGRDVDRFRITTDFGSWDKSSFDLLGMVSESYRCLKQGGYFICFYDLWKVTVLKTILEEVGFKQIRLIEWLKTNPVPINSKVNYLTNCREVAICAVKGSKPTFHSEYDSGIYMFPICRDKGRFHPTQKPLDLIKVLIEKHSNEGDLVLDCCMGSGTTAVACIQTNRNFIGFETDREYYEKSIARINSAA